MRLLHLTLPAVACLLGCSSEQPTGPVSGRVTLDGKPVTAESKGSKGSMGGWGFFGKR